MKLKETSGFLKDELTYPIDQTSVIEKIGEREIEAPNQQENETIAVIIDPIGREKYFSSDELFNTIIGNLSDDYIGRKFYDDRGSDPLGTASERREEVDISF
jgi:hypothetical protein